MVFNPSPFFWAGGLSNGLMATVLNDATHLVEDRFDPPKTLAWLEQEQRPTAILCRRVR